MPVVLVLVRPQAKGFCVRNRLHLKISGQINSEPRNLLHAPNGYTIKIFRIHCVMIPDSMVVDARCFVVFWEFGWPLFGQSCTQKAEHCTKYHLEFISNNFVTRSTS